MILAVGKGAKPQHFITWAHEYRGIVRPRVHLPTAERTDSMIVDISDDTTEVDVISLARIVYANFVRVAGDRLDDAIVSVIESKPTHNGVMCLG